MIREYIIYNPDSINVLIALGEVFINESRFQESIDTYQRLINFYPDSVKYYQKLADSHWNLRNNEDAFLFYEKVLDKVKETKMFFYDLVGLFVLTVFQ